MLLYLWSYHYPPALLWCTTSGVLAQHASTCATIFFYLAGIDFRLKCLLPPTCQPFFPSFWRKRFFFLSLYVVSRKKGAILNISSASGMYPVPLLTVYSASKVIVVHGVWPSHQMLLEGIPVGTSRLHKQFVNMHCSLRGEEGCLVLILQIIVLLTNIASGKT